MDYLRQGIHLRAYAQKNPKQEYKRESFEMFQGLLEGVKAEVVRVLSRIEVKRRDEHEELERRRRAEMEKMKLQLQHAEASSALAEGNEKAPEQASAAPFVRDGKKVGRNEVCPCGSGKKFKQCHGKVA